MLDYDGTLSPIASRPELANLPDTNRDLLQTIISQPNVAVAIISGRAIDSAKEKVGFDNFIYAGNHGYEIKFPDGYTFNYQFTDNMLESFEKMVFDLNTICRDGAWVEDKKYSLTFHYRQVPPELHKELITRASDIVKNRGFNPSPAHMAVEAKPPLSWNKGYAAEYILKHLYGENWAKEANVIFMGDDTTDEDVMRMLGDKALTFRITADPNLPTSATYRIPSTDTVTDVLTKIKKRLLKDFH